MHLGRVLPTPASRLSQASVFHNMRHPDSGAAARRHPALSPCPASQQVLKLIPDNESNLYPSVLHIPSPSLSFYKPSSSNSIPADSKSRKPRPTPTQQAAQPSEQAARYECQGCLAMRSLPLPVLSASPTLFSESMRSRLRPGGSAINRFYRNALYKPSWIRDCQPRAIKARSFLQLLIAKLQKRLVAIPAFTNQVPEVLPRNWIKILTSHIGNGLSGIVEPSKIRQPRGDLVRNHRNAFRLAVCLQTAPQHPALGCCYDASRLVNIDADNRNI